jgi:hypothetical protein
MSISHLPNLILSLQYYLKWAIELRDKIQQQLKGAIEPLNLRSYGRKIRTSTPKASALTPNPSSAVTKGI